MEVNGFGRAAAAGVAAFFVGLVAYAVAGRVRVPPLVVAVPAIVPFLPGLSIYRGLTWLADGGYLVSQGILALMTAISVAIALASGVILGEYVAQPLKREARKLESRLAGPRLVGPFRAMTRAERRALQEDVRRLSSASRSSQRWCVPSYGASPARTAATSRSQLACAASITSAG